MLFLSTLPCCDCSRQLPEGLGPPAPARCKSTRPISLAKAKIKICACSFSPVYMALAKKRCICFVRVFHIHRFSYTPVVWLKKKITTINIFWSLSVEPWSHLGRRRRSGQGAAYGLLSIRRDGPPVAQGVQQTCQARHELFAISGWAIIRFVWCPEESSRSAPSHRHPQRKTFHILPCILHWPPTSY